MQISVFLDIALMSDNKVLIWEPSRNEVEQWMAAEDSDRIHMDPTTNFGVISQYW